MRVGVALASFRRTMKIALIQLQVGACKSKNLESAGSKVAEAAENGAQLVILPECFNSPYGVKYFSEYAETIPDETFNFLCNTAKKRNIWLVGGSFPEREGDKLYNTCTAFNPSGSLVATHRKVHLFDIDVPGKITFKESDALSQGSHLTIFDAPPLKIGLGICYDIRFAEMAQIYAKRGCNLLIYPGAFNMTTGPAHWELLARARALDNQLFVISASVARNKDAEYQAWGHSLVCDPWGSVIAKTDEKESIIYCNIDLNRLEEVRKQIPTTKQKRTDLYGLVEH